MEEFKNNPAPFIQFGWNNIMKCPQCNLICSIKYDEYDYLKIKYNCENGHSGNEKLRDFFTKSLSNHCEKVICFNCKDKCEIDNYKNYYYCINCSSFFCNLCGHFHQNDTNHKVIAHHKYDSLCRIHSLEFKYICLKCNKNICEKCKNEHIFHNLRDISEFLLEENNTNKIRSKISELRTLLNDIESLKNNLNNMIEKISKEITFRIQFIDNLYMTYEYEINNHNLNYHVIKNLMNFSGDFIEYQKKIINLIQNEGNKFYVHLKKSTNEYYNELKILSNSISKHKSIIKQMELLENEKLISLSEESLNFYRKKTFDLYLSVKSNEEYFESFHQLSKNDLILCYKKGKIKILNHVGNIYNYLQTIEAHDKTVYEALKLNSSTSFISVSKDKTMKLWRKNIDSYNCLDVIFFQNNESFCNIFIIRNNEFLTLSYKDKILKFWDLKNNIFIEKNSIDNIIGNPTHKNICLISDKILCVVGKGFYMINIDNYQLIHTIGDYNIFSICLKGNGNIYCGIQEGELNNIIEFNYNNGIIKKINERKNADKKLICSILQYYDNSIISGGECINVWV